MKTYISLDLDYYIEYKIRPQKRLEDLIKHLHTIQKHTTKKIFIAISHEYLLKDPRIEKADELWNVDYHADFYTKSVTSFEDCDCGNWIDVLINNNKLKQLKWITRRGCASEWQQFTGNYKCSLVKHNVKYDRLLSFPRIDTEIVGVGLAISPEYCTNFSNSDKEILESITEYTHGFDTMVDNCDPQDIDITWNLRTETLLNRLVGIYIKYYKKNYTPHNVKHLLQQRGFKYGS